MIVALFFCFCASSAFVFRMQLLQLNHTQFICLKFFMDKTVENRKNLAHYIIPTFKTDYLDVVGLVFTISNFYIDKIQIN